MRVLAVGGCVLSLALLAGCGSIGEPLYPALHIPSRVTDLIVVERGDNLDMYFTVPSLTTEGLPVKQIGGIDLRVGPGSNNFNADEWAKTATRVDVAVPDKPGPIHAVTPATKLIGNEVIVAVRISNTKGRDAGWSDFKIFSVQPPVADPTNFRVASDPKGVALSWSASAPSQFRIYRQTEQQPQPVLLATTMDPNYVDISAEFGKSYRYSLEAVRTDNIESNLIGPETITPLDIFAPAVPANLTVSIGLGSLELAWNRNTEATFKEYRVLRSEEGGAFVEIARGLDAPVYSDHAIQSGKHYRYEVLSVGENGMASMPCPPVEMTAP
jgi:hypothetical protein